MSDETNISAEESAARSFFSNSYGSTTPTTKAAPSAVADLSDAEQRARSMHPNSYHTSATMKAEPLTAPTPVKPEQTKPVDSEQARAEAMFPSMQEKPTQNYTETTPQDLRALRDADRDRAFFSPQRMYGADLPDSLFDNTTDENGNILPVEHRQAIAAEYREIAADLGLSSPDVRTFAATLKQVTANPPSDQEAQQWQADSQRWLQGKFGKDAPKALELAQKLVRRDPRVHALIHSAGEFGNHPKMVEMLVNAAQAEHRKGRLK
jgi:hypothetical protein